MTTRPKGYWSSGQGDEDIRRLAAQGMTMTRIAKSLGVCTATVKSRCVTLGILSGASQHIDSRTAQVIRGMAEAGASDDDMATALGVSQKVVTCWRNDLRRGIHVFDEEDDRIIRDMFEHGASDAEIAGRLGTSKNVVAARRCKLGLQYHKKTPEISPEQLSALVGGGLTDAEIAERFGIRTKSVITNMRKRYGTEKKARVGEKDIDEHDLRHLIFDEGMTDKQIAAHYGCSYMTVYNRRKHLGIERQQPPRVSEDDLWRYVNADMTDAEISEKTGASFSSVKNSVRKFGLTGIRRTLALTNDEIKALFDAGESDEQIAQKAKCTASAIMSRRHDMGLFRKSGWIDVPEDELRTMVSLGLSNDEICAQFSCSLSILYDRFHRYGILREDGYSEPERMWKKRLTEWGLSEGRDFIHNDHGLLKTREIDFLFADKGVGLEVNPAFTHASDEVVLDYNKPKPPTYHQRKKLDALELGVNVIQAYDWQDQEILASILKAKLGLNERRVGARSCSVVAVPRQDERAFMRQYHLQGFVPSEVCLGLILEGEPLCMMSFGAPRYESPEACEWEMLRFATKSGVTVAGGASRLFAHFIRSHRPESVISFANLDISDGAMYERLGFERTRVTKPSCTWVDPNEPSRHYGWQLITSRGVDNVLGTSFGKGARNDDLMREMGFVRVFNSGSFVYVWRRDG